jgi:hypothetical protein
LSSIKIQASDEACDPIHDLNANLTHSYQVQKSKKSLDKATNQEIFKIKISKNPLMFSNKSKVKRLDSESTDDNSPRAQNNKGFKPLLFSESTFCSGIMDLQTSEIDYDDNLEHLITGKENLTEKKFFSFLKFCREYTISDEQRKTLWRKRIGNELGITKETYRRILHRVENKLDVPRKMEKQITNDLKRLFPDCKTFSEGKKMYKSLEILLQCFHLYRPDIGYVQGMTYIATSLYYYFEGLELFILFSNFIVTNKLMKILYNFNISKVKKFPYKKIVQRSQQNIRRFDDQAC